MRHYHERTGIPAGQLVRWIGIGSSKFHTWKDRYGKANEHNGHVPRDWWLTDEEKRAILDFHDQHPLDGYRRLTFMMIDRDVVAASPSSVYRVLREAGRLDKRRFKASTKGNGFDQPAKPHQHWHVDVSYIRVAETFYYLCSILDGFSRTILHWELRDRMTERDVETILQRARERFPDEKPRVISDNGPQFVAREFKIFIALAGMTHVRTSPYYPQSNGKIERWHQSLKSEKLRLDPADSPEEARKQVERYVDYYNTVRLHGAIEYVTPLDKLEGRAKEILERRDQKLEAAREQRRLLRRQAALAAGVAS